MIKYHPDVRFLTDYASGSLPASQALCVATHLQLCANCRTKVRELTELGAELFARQATTRVTPAEFGRLLQRIDAEPAPLGAVAPVAAGGMASLPQLVQKLARGDLGQLRWRKVGRNFRYAPLNTGDSARETSFLHIAAGGSVPHHRHRGDEITVILKGSFSDSEDKYTVGDFVVRTRGESHRPVASQDQDCLCLATLDAPISMSSWMLRLAQFVMNRFSREQFA